MHKLLLALALATVIACGQNPVGGGGVNITPPVPGAGSIPTTSLAPQAPNTILGNATSGTASPTAVPGGTLQGSGGAFVPSPQTLAGVTIVAWGDSITAGNEDLSTGILTATVASGGATYAVGDLVTVTQGGASGGQLRVTAVASGVVSQVQIVLTSQGTGYSIASGLATTGGTGTGLTVNITAIGDSFPAYLQSMLGATVLNKGVGGDNSTQISARMLAAPQYFGDCVVIEAGRNNYTSPSTVLADIASMVAALTPPKCFVVMGILNGGGETTIQNPGNYAALVALNASFQAAYPNNYLDPRTALIAGFNPSNIEDLADHNQDFSPSTLRASEVQGTLTGAIANTSTCSITTTGSFLGNGLEILVDTEKILATTTSGGNTISACTRGYLGTTAATHSNGANVSIIDALHPGALGYQLIAAQLASWFTNPNTLGTPAIIGSSGNTNPGAFFPFTAQPGIFTNISVSAISGSPGLPPISIIGKSGVTNPFQGLAGNPGAFNIGGAAGFSDYDCFGWYNAARYTAGSLGLIGADCYTTSLSGSGSTRVFYGSTNYNFTPSLIWFTMGPLTNVSNLPLSTTAYSVAGTKPTITGCGTISSQTGGSMSGTFATSAISCTAVLTAMPTATNGYNCFLWDQTTATGVTYGNIASTATSATFPTITTIASDVLRFACPPSY